MQLGSIIAIAVVVLVLGTLIGVPLVATILQTRRDRRRIMAEGTTGQATITTVGAAAQGGGCSVSFQFEIPETGRRVNALRIRRSTRSHRLVSK